MFNITIDLNPLPDGRKGVLRQLSCIIGGLIKNDGAVGGSRTLLTVNLRLINLRTCTKRLSRCPVSKCHSNDPNAECFVCDFLVVAHVEPGPFQHDGVNGCEFVLDEQRKPRPDVKEEQVKEQLKQQFGIEMPGYKGLYSNLYYKWLARN